VYAKDYPSIIAKLTLARSSLSTLDPSSADYNENIAKINSAITHAIDIFAALTHFLRSETLQD